jgi:hypothetical protein
MHAPTILSIFSISPTLPNFQCTLDSQNSLRNLVFQPHHTHPISTHSGSPDSHSQGATIRLIERTPARQTRAAKSIAASEKREKTRKVQLSPPKKTPSRALITKSLMPPERGKRGAYNGRKIFFKKMSIFYQGPRNRRSRARATVIGGAK